MLITANKLTPYFYDCYIMDWRLRILIAQKNKNKIKTTQWLRNEICYISPIETFYLFIYFSEKYKLFIYIYYVILHK